MTSFGKGILLGGFSTALVLGMKILGAYGWLIILTILAVAIFFTWLPDKYITSSNPRPSPKA